MFVSITIPKGNLYKKDDNQNIHPALWRERGGAILKREEYSLVGEIAANYRHLKLFNPISEGGGGIHPPKPISLIALIFA